MLLTDEQRSCVLNWYRSCYKISRSALVFVPCACLTGTVFKAKACCCCCFPRPSNSLTNGTEKKKKKKKKRKQAARPLERQAKPQNPSELLPQVCMLLCICLKVLLLGVCWVCTEL